jgi:hypothetical protein
MRCNLSSVGIGGMINPESGFRIRIPGIFKKRTLSDEQDPAAIKKTEFQ